MEPLAYCNVLLIGLTCWVSYLGFRSAEFESRHIFWPQAVFAGEYRRLLTSGFLHADGRHLLFNMISLYLFGSIIEFEFGALQFLVIYFVSIFGGSVLSLFIHKHHYEYRAYGASGGVCGVIFAHIFLFPGGSIGMYFLPIWIPSWLYAIGFLIGSFWAMKSRRDNIGHDAHIGGALFGLAATVLIHPGVAKESPKLLAAVVVILGLILVYVAKNPLFLPLESFALFKKPELLRKNRFSKRTEQFDIDGILEKVSAQGIHTLTDQEKALLMNTSEKYRRRAESKKPESGLII